ncbi:hypothetical protein FRZ61_08440 [Hypericibacter adhaerens]|uniref:HTH araC/xylS-type domain-containing protein n=1 Tax=Hypericibacter adhaerens TaxID=2602016 RepID=A0A5J6MUR8_9PROT|nr:helix-turn-helix transcriptional regulator [Hypericibacter adhaerens]QEX20924.1 hypothetical protein FRZ61_08440 [Hypericibacter adhaerens]
MSGARLEIDHHHPEIECDLIIRGTGSLTLDDRTYALKPGTLIWLLPGQRHRLVRSPHLEMWVLLLRPHLVEASQLAELAEQPLRQLPGEEFVDLDRLLSQVSQDSDQPSVYNAGLAYLAMRAWRASRNSPPARLRPMHAAVTRALLLLRESGASMSLSELSQAAGVAAPYLSRLLVEHSGRSFLEWRNRIRLDRFMQAYRPGANLLNVALEAGFGSYARFHDVFSELVGCAPSDWVRRAEQKGAAAEEEGGAALPADFGMPAAGTLSARQGWTHLVPLIGPLIGERLGPGFLDRLLADGRGDARALNLERLDASLPAAERKRLIASLRAGEPAGAEDLAGLLEAHDFPGTYAGILKAFELSPTRFADAITALALAIWVAANRGSDPGLGHVEAVGRQTWKALGGVMPRLDARAAQELHSALICQFVVTYRALQAARASGDPRAQEEVSAAARRLGQAALGGDVTRVVLTDRGFLRRGKEPAAGDGDRPSAMREPSESPPGSLEGRRADRQGETRRGKERR